MFERARLSALLVTACLLVLGGCGDSADDERADTTAPPSTQPAEPARPLPAGWYDDPDGDVIPRAVEREIGTDPDVDGCVRDGGCGEAEATTALERSNTLLILDSSGSMAGPAGGGTTKLNAAKQAVRRYVAGVPDSFALGFMVYGHKGSNNAGGKARSCAGVELLDPIGSAASERFDRTLDRFRPRGYTPLGAALRKARDAFSGKESDINRIILVTDGVETCGGDPVAEARKLKRADIKVTTDVVGFDVAKPDEARRLRAIAEASGGEYSDARTADALDDFFEQARERVNALSRQSLCLMENGGKIGLCQQESVGKARLFMIDAAADASRAGRTEEADEIERLHKQVQAAGDTRYDDFQAQSEADLDRV